MGEQPDRRDPGDDAEPALSWRRPGVVAFSGLAGHPLVTGCNDAVTDQGEVGRRADEPADDEPERESHHHRGNCRHDAGVEMAEGQGKDQRRHDVRQDERRRQADDRQDRQSDPPAGEEARQGEEPPCWAAEADKERGEERRAPAHGLALGAGDGPVEAPTSASSWLSACWTRAISSPYLAKLPSRSACWASSKCWLAYSTRAATSPDGGV